MVGEGRLHETVEVSPRRIDHGRDGHSRIGRHVAGGDSDQRRRGKAAAGKKSGRVCDARRDAEPQDRIRARRRSAAFAVSSEGEFPVSFGGSKIDLASVQVSYLKTPAVDLTERIKPYLSVDGIDMPAAELPPGEHPIRIDIKDSEGRAGSANVVLKITP